MAAAIKKLFLGSKKQKVPPDVLAFLQSRFRLCDAPPLCAYVC